MVCGVLGWRWLEMLLLMGQLLNQGYTGSSSDLEGMDGSDGRNLHLVSLFVDEGFKMTVAL